ncbi:hypothetical protein ACQR5W_11695 [Xanthomonas sacchari]
MDEIDKKAGELYGLIRKLRERAKAARVEGNCTALSDAWHFDAAADALEASHSDEVTRLLKERDEAEDMADQLAEQIATITGEEIGEHSSANDPWQNAMLAADKWIADDLSRMFSGRPEKSAERDQLRAEKQQFREEAVRWAEEAGRLKALLHDAQRDAERYAYLKSRYNPTLMWLLAERREPEEWDAEIDAAMAAEREGQG